MDINSLYNISSDVIKNNYTGSIGKSSEVEGKDAFASFFQSAVDSINTTNSYISDYEDEEIKLALGETENTHDLTIALQKASTAISYTVAVRDRFLEAYNTIMQMQI
jgi:flagellar hook-basal body complex protein FliE